MVQNGVPSGHLKGSDPAPPPGGGEGPRPKIFKVEEISLEKSKSYTDVKSLNMQIFFNFETMSEPTPPVGGWGRGSATKNFPSRKNFFRKIKVIH